VLSRAPLGAVIVASIGLLLASSVPAGPRLSMERPSNPGQNIAPSPDILSSGTCNGSAGGYTCVNPCVSGNLTWPVFASDPACTAYVLSAINNARALENLSPMVLPTNWDSLTIPEQLLVATDLERVARGYPPYLGLNVNLNHAAMVAALANADPALATGFATGYDALGATAWGGTWAGGYNVLAADYMMVYSDGWGGVAGTSNIDCVSARSPACWSHRDELLGSDATFNDGVGLWCSTCEMGAAYAVVKGASSYTQLVEFPAARPPSMLFRWQDELSYFPSGAIGTVKTIAMARVAFANSTLRVVWSIGGVQNASLAAVYTFRGSTCARVSRVATFRYVAAFNIRRSTVTISGAAYFPHRGPYSAVVRIYAPSGTMTSNCVPVGHN